MVGTSGSTWLRVLPLTPSARSLPLFTWGDSVVTVAMIALVCPPVTSMTAGPEPRNGT